MTEAGLFAGWVEKFRDKYPNIEEMLERGRDGGQAVQAIRHQGIMARRAGDLLEATRLTEMARDLEGRNKSDVPLTVPSWEHRGEEASCPRCQDMKWLNRGGEYVVCPNCSAFDMEAVRLKHSGIPEARQHQTLQSFKGTVHPIAKLALEDAWNFVNGGKPWLVLSGNPGCGKTHLARGAALELIHQGWDVIYTTSIALSTQLIAASTSKDIDLADAMKKLKEVGLLVVDDYGSEKQSDFITPAYEEIFNARYDAMGATIITTNVPSEIIKRDISPRIHSRMGDRELSVWRDMKGVLDYRG